jgi:predicted Zn-dependent peptidase
LPDLPSHQGYELLEQRLGKKENSQQASIRLGSLSLPTKHPDYKPLQMLYGALGGYMGSRLMQNLREKHGYTYGVYVEWENYPQYSVQCIVGDFIFEHRHKVMEQIFLEIDRLQQEPMPEEELQDFKRYLKGSFSSRLDGISKLNRFYAGLIAQDQRLDLSHVKFDYLETVSAEQLQQLAQQYLHKDKMLAVMVY